MSEEAEKESINSEGADKPPRPLEQIQQEYNEVCAMIGEREYRRKILEAEALQLHQKLLSLNQEADRLKQPVPQ